MGHIGEIAQLFVGVSLLGNMLIALLNFMQSRHNGKQIDAVHQATNSMKDALVASTAKASYAEGLQEGRGTKRDPES
jgi:hypothetical protein